LSGRITLNNLLQAVAIMAAGKFLFAIQDVIIKEMSDGYPVHQIRYLCYPARGPYRSETHRLFRPHPALARKLPFNRIGGNYRVV